MSSTPVRVPSRVSSIAPAQFDVLNARAAELRSDGHHVISLGQALPGFGPPQAAIDAAQRALATPDAHVYSADAGLLSLREALCERLAADGASRQRTRGDEGDASEERVKPDEVIITAGGNQAFMLALMTLVDPGDEVLLPSPYFVNHEMAIAALGAVPREVPLEETRGFALRWQDLQAHITARTRAVVVCTPSNPTGAVIARDEMTAIVRELGRRNVLLFSDETYARFMYGEHATHVSATRVPGWRENVVIVNTFSKSFGMTGWRVGYILAHRDVCEQAIKIQDAMIICAPVISQIGVEAALRESWDYPLRFLPELVARRALLIDGLDKIPQLHWMPTSGGFFAFVRVAGCVDSARLSNEILERAHVVTIPGSTFGRAGEGFIRLSYSAVSREDLAEALARLRRFFRDDAASKDATYTCRI